ncbi:protein of unknown function [Allopseudospirillum japonicum]|uniref:DUF4214 domain-containing protein n=1 Tax=Allopseudospirillum japonicum TaxID=64971 RepID=A0A1H6RFI2_9GAMM|nr:DUF4214 domain-containing protein [Allopseudospirillum japonicum]SEI50590.1 protein of unknown function [Allopseudospirillum japonicum]
MALLDDFIGGSGDASVTGTTDNTDTTTTDTSTTDSTPVTTDTGLSTGATGGSETILDELLGNQTDTTDSTTDTTSEDTNASDDSTSSDQGETQMTATETLINGLYNEVLYRDADTSGLSFWAAQFDAGTINEQGVRDALAGSAEYTNSVAPIQKLYTEVLGRDGDADGVKFWVGSGADAKAVAASFATSSEFTALGLSDADAVARLEAGLGIDLAGTTLDAVVSELTSTGTDTTTDTTTDTNTDDTTDDADGGLFDDFLGGGNNTVNDSNGAVADGGSDSANTDTTTDTTTDTNTDDTTDDTTDTNTDDVITDDTTDDTTDTNTDDTTDDTTPETVDGDALTTEFDASAGAFIFEFEQKAAVVTIDGFGEDDVIKFLDGVVEGDVNVTNTAFGDGELLMLVGELEVTLTGLANDSAINGATFAQNVGTIEYA